MYHSIKIKYLSIYLYLICEISAAATLARHGSIFSVIRYFVYEIFSDFFPFGIYHSCQTYLKHLLALGPYKTSLVLLHGVLDRMMQYIMPSKVTVTSVFKRSLRWHIVIQIMEWLWSRKCCASAPCKGDQANKVEVFIEHNGYRNIEWTKWKRLDGQCLK